MQHQPSARRQRGFSLVEIIVIVVVAGFLGVLLVNLLGTQLVKSTGPAITAREAAEAEAAMEAVVAYYAGEVNNNANLASALANVKTHYQDNATVSFTSDDANWQGTGTRVVTVTVTVGSTQLTTLLTQSRTNAADTNTNY